MGNRPLLIDLFCKQGGTSMGYYRAGFDIIGIDKDPQPRYPFEFIQGDVFEVWDSLPHDRVTAYAASPPCQAFSQLNYIHKNNHPDLIQQTRTLLQKTNKHYMIENVPHAPLINPIQLCGSSFGLRVRKHRRFELSIFMLAPPCQHYWQDQDKIFTVRNHGKTVPSGICYVFGQGTGKGEDWNGAMDINWMTRDGLREAIPPAYTKWIGEQLLKII